MADTEEKEIEDEISPEEDVKVDQEAFHTAEGPRGSLLKRRSKEIMASISASCGALALGTAIGWTSPALPQLYGLYNEEEMSWIGSLLAIGAALTTIHTGFLIDRLGRRATIIIQLFPFTIGWLLLAFGSHYIAMLFIGRLLLGFASGSMCMTAPMYIGEISSPDVRGSLATLFQLLLTFGILFVYVWGTFTSILPLCLSCLVWAWINGITMLFMPESPYFLAKHKMMEAASRAILWFRPQGNPEEEFKEMQESLEIKEESFFRVMKSKPSRKAAVTSFLLMFFQQTSGINVVMFYAEPLFIMSNAAISGEDATIVLGVLQFVVTGIAAFIVDKTGRRILLIISFSAMAICQFLLAIYFHLFFPDTMNWLPLFCIYLYLISFSIGAGPLPWTMLGELLPPGAKGSVSSVAVFINWGLAFVVTKTFYTIKNDVILAAPFWVYGIFCTLGSIWVLFLLPETKGKTLEEIQREFEGQRDV